MSIGCLFLLHVRQVAPTWFSPALCPVEPRLSSIRWKRTAATRSPHHCAADPMPQCESCVANEFVVDEGIGGRRLHHNARPDAVEVCGTSFDLNL